MAFLCKLAERAVGTNKRIVLVEGQDERVREAAVQLQKAVHVEPLLLVPDASFDGPAGWSGPVRCPAEDPDLGRYAELYRQIRGPDAVDAATARQQAADPLYFAGLMIRAASDHVSHRHAPVDLFKSEMSEIGGNQGQFLHVVRAARRLGSSLDNGPMPSESWS